MKRYSLFRAASAGLLLTLFVCAVNAKDTWVSVRSKNFHFIGNGGEKDVRRVAAKLEQFREVFTRLFQGVKFDTNVPSTVVVFKSKSSYKPFNPGNNAGYFQSGEDVNYITLTTETNDNTPFSTIYHEYVHLLLNNNATNVPTWFNEGLAEYYSTFRIEDNQKVYLGDIIPEHILLLRQEKLLPLTTLLNVDRYSPYYNERNKRGIFYAQSWALTHYLLIGNNSQRAPQLPQFMRLLQTRQPLAAAFQQAFQTTPEALEKELRKYIDGNDFKLRIYTAKEKMEFDTGAQAATLSEADAQAYLGDLLLHTRDYKGAEERLQQALALDAAHPMANASLGLLRTRQNRFADAINLLKKASQGETKNHLAHYYYAFALSRVGLDTNNMAGNYAPESVAIMRAELLKAIKLAPTFPESYSLLAFINLVAGAQLEESAELLQRAITLAPGRQDLSLMLAQVYLRQQRVPQARQTLEPLTQLQNDQRVKNAALQLLDVIKRIEEVQSEGGVLIGSPQFGPRPQKELTPPTPDMGEKTPTPEELRDQAIRQALRPTTPGETRVQGWFTKLECDNRGVAYFHLRTDTRAYRIRSFNLSTLQLIAYTPLAGGQLGCGPRKEEENVVFTFRPATEAKDLKAKVDGDAISVEIVPKGFKLTP
jgi:tetratricopeptide (TPR) repeat protein